MQEEYIFVKTQESEVLHISTILTSDKGKEHTTLCTDFPIAICTYFGFELDGEEDRHLYASEARLCAALMHNGEMEDREQHDVCSFCVQKLYSIK